jgi:hypothetical protein
MNEVHEMGTQPASARRLGAASAAAALLAGAGVMFGAFMAPANAASPGDKWFVCKFTTTPGGDEVLQSGQNPISVSENAIPVSPVQPGSSFSDAQGLSIVLVQDTGQAEPSPQDCLALIESTPPPSSTPALPSSPAVPGSSTPAPIPVAVAAGQHSSVSDTTVLLGSLLMVAGVGGVMTAWRPWKRGSH